MFPNSILVIMWLVTAFILALIIDCLIDKVSSRRNKNIFQVEEKNTAFKSKRSPRYEFCSDANLMRFMNGSHFGSSFNSFNYAGREKVPVNIALDYFRQAIEKHIHKKE